MCIALGTLTAADVAAFATLVELVATQRAASALKDGDGFTAGACRVERQTAVAVRWYYSAFGLTAADRARLRLRAPTTDASNPLEKFWRRRWAGELR